MEEINDIIRDHLIPTSMWDSEKYCSMSWKITVDLQTWDELEEKYDVSNEGKRR